MVVVRSRHPDRRCRLDASQCRYDFAVAEQQLGQMLYMDTDLPLERNQSCITCHAVQPVGASAVGETKAVAGLVDP